VRNSSVGTTWIPGNQERACWRRDRGTAMWPGDEHRKVAAPKKYHSLLALFADVVANFTEYLLAEVVEAESFIPRRREPNVPALRLQRLTPAVAAEHWFQPQRQGPSLFASSGTWSGCGQPGLPQQQGGLKALRRWCLRGRPRGGYDGGGPKERPSPETKGSKQAGEKRRWADRGRKQTMGRGEWAL